MPNSLFIEHHADGLAFYINGDLQFDTADEALYHEYLVL
jgi:spermidine synthase